MVIFIGHSEKGVTIGRRKRSVVSYQGLGVLEGE